MLGKQNIILFGAGTEGEYFIYNNLNILPTISFCIDNNKTGYFHGKPVMCLDEVEIGDLRSSMTVITVGEYSAYNEMALTLQTLGLIEFEHFIWGKCFGKKLVFINANCYGVPLKDFYYHWMSLILSIFCGHQKLYMRMEQEK